MPNPSQASAARREVKPKFFASQRRTPRSNARRIQASATAPSSASFASSYRLSCFAVSNQSGLLTDSCVIYHYEKTSNLMTSEPSPREVVVKLLMMKLSNKKKSRRTPRSLQGTKISDRQDGEGEVVLAYSIVPTAAAERSFWPTLLFLRQRRRGRFGLLYSSHGDNGECTMKVVCSFDLLS